jgi:hypothetical protein
MKSRLSHPTPIVPCMSPRVLVLTPADNQRLIGWDPDDEAAEAQAQGFLSLARRHGFRDVSAKWHDRGRDWFALSR